MITVTLEKRNGVAIGASENATMGIESKMLARPPQPLTANTTSSKCRLWVKMDKGGPVVEEWLVTETYATVKTNLTADDAEVGAELTANKDATGGYAGLTLFKLNMKNVLGTITSWFTNANTAARTYTFQDRDGTIADDTDLALKAPLASPALTGTPTAPTAAVGVSTTQLATTEMVQSRAKVTPNATAAGTDAYTATVAVGTGQVTAAAGLLIVVKFTNANTGAATLNINGTSAVDIKKKDGTTALSATDITAGSYQMLFHDGTSWVALGIA